MKKNIAYGFFLALFALVSVAAPLGSAPKAEASGPTNKLIMIGGGDPNNQLAATSDVWMSNNNQGVQWTQLTANASWSARVNHQVQYFNGKIYLMGGLTTGSGTFMNDVWSSSDGVNWTQLTANAPWAGRIYFVSYVFNNKIYIAGGENSTGDLSDVWSSSDGINWTQETANAAFGQREQAMGVVFQNKMWLMGGQGPNGQQSDVWRSTDGITWTQTSNNAQWPSHLGASAVVFQNRIWVIGGYIGSGLFANDVWRSGYISGNTVQWVQVTPNALWSGRADMSVASIGGNLMLLAGATGLTVHNDVYRSTYGATWTQQTANAPWTARSGQAVVVVPASFNIGTPCTPSVNVVSPNGGETFIENQSITVNWTSSCNTGTLGIYLGYSANNNSIIDQWGPTSAIITTQGQISGSTTLILSGLGFDHPGDFAPGNHYKIFIVEGQGNPYFATVYDSSDNFFTINP